MEMTINEEISAYEGLRARLEVDHTGKWALVHQQSLVGLFDSSEDAAEEAVRKFGRGPYLIRHIGAPPTALPASLAYCPIDAQFQMRF